LTGAFIVDAIQWNGLGCLKYMLLLREADRRDNLALLKETNCTINAAKSDAKLYAT
jgi:hypothetical protein